MVYNCFKKGFKNCENWVKSPARHRLFVQSYYKFVHETFKIFGDEIFVRDVFASRGSLTFDRVT